MVAIVLADKQEKKKEEGLEESVNIEIPQKEISSNVNPGAAILIPRKIKRIEVSVVKKCIKKSMSNAVVEGTNWLILVYWLAFCQFISGLLGIIIGVQLESSIIPRYRNYLLDESLYNTYIGGYLLEMIMGLFLISFVVWNIKLLMKAWVLFNCLFTSYTVMTFAFHLIIQNASYDEDGFPGTFGDFYLKTNIFVLGSIFHIAQMSIVLKYAYGEKDEDEDEELIISPKKVITLKRIPVSHHHHHQAQDKQEIIQSQDIEKCPEP